MYNEKYQELKKQIEDLEKEAKSNGWSVLNGQLVQNQYAYVLEFIHRCETTYESSGYYWGEKRQLD